MPRKNRGAKRLHDLTLCLQGSGPLMIHEPSAADLHGAMLRMWEDREIDSEALGVTLRRSAASSSSPADGPQIVGGIGIVQITGMIRSKEDLWTERGFGTAAPTVAKQVKALLANDSVYGVLMVVDSPGGQAIGNEEASRAIRAAAEASSKPVWCAADGNMCSAAYYLGAAADRVISVAGSIIGSIGAVLIHTQWRPEDATFTVTRFGEMKVRPNMYEPIGDQGQAENQRVVDQFGNKFLSTVAEFRGVAADKAATQFGAGRVFYQASEQIAAGLVDAAAASVEEVLHQMQAEFRPQSQSMQALLEASCFSNHESGKRAAANATHQENDAMNPKIKAALYARGLIANLDASNDVYEAALTAFFAGRGEAKPTDEAQQLAALNGTAQAKVIQAAAEPLKNPAQAAHDREQAEAKAEAARNERERIKTIRDAGAKLGVDEKSIQAAIDSDDDAPKAIAGMVHAMKDSRKPVVSNPIASGEDAFAKDALAAMCLGAGIKSDGEPSADAKRLAGMSLFDMGRASLKVQGVRFDEWGHKESVAKLALVTGGSQSEVMLDDGSGVLNRPSSFPNLLSAFANKLIDAGIDRSQPSYPLWTGVLPGGLPDFKDAPLISRSNPYVMDEVIDDEGHKQFKLSEECLSILRVRRFADKFGVTPVMLANDDTGAFVEALINFGMAWESTVNLICLNLLTANVYLLDGYQLFDNTNHGNDVSSGAAPSAAQWDAMQLKYAAQKTVGGEAYVRGVLGAILYPPTINQSVRQTFAPLGALPEDKQPVTDATVNVYRGTVKMIPEAELQRASATAYYGMVDPLLYPTVVRVYQRGWGEGLRRNAWVNPETGVSWVNFEGRVGAGVKNYRSSVRNNGA